jgi:anti-anti-sigma regulatory factor
MSFVEDQHLCTAISRIGQSLVVALSSDMDDSELIRIKDMVYESVIKLKVKQVILDYSNVEVIDSFMYKKFCNISEVLQLMGNKVVWCGFQPAVVSSFLDIGLCCKNEKLIMAKDVDSAILKMEA